MSQEKSFKYSYLIHSLGRINIMFSYHTRSLGRILIIDKFGNITYIWLTTKYFNTHIHTHTYTHTHIKAQMNLYARTYIRLRMHIISRAHARLGARVDVFIWSAHSPIYQMRAHFSQRMTKEIVEGKELHILDNF